jgi:hypothetical protein
MPQRKPTFKDLRSAVLLFGRRSALRIPECESDEWTGSTAREVLVQAGLLDESTDPDGPQLTEEGSGIYRRLVTGFDSRTLRELANRS